MNKLYLSYLMLFLIFIMHGNLSAQSDYIVTVKGDTLYGKIKDAFLGKLKFKQTGKIEFEVIDVDKHSQYFISKDTINFVSIQLPQSKKREFLKRLEFGKIQLYEKFVSHPTTTGTGGLMIGGGASFFWYAGFTTDQLLEIKTNSLLGSRAQRESNFDSLLRSRPELLDSFKKKKSFSADMLRYFIQRYNAEDANKVD
jgi:hypothetical protein